MNSILKKHTIVVTVVLALIVCVVLYRQRASTQNNFADHPVQSVQPSVISASPESAAGENIGLPMPDAVSAPIPTIEYASEPKVIHYGTVTRSDEEIQEEMQRFERLNEEARQFDLTTVEGHRQWLKRQVELEESGFEVNNHRQRLSWHNPDYPIDPVLDEERRKAQEEVRKALYTELGIPISKPVTAAENLEQFDSLSREEQERTVFINNSGALAGALRLGSNGPDAGTINGVPYRRIRGEMSKTFTLSDGSSYTVTSTANHLSIGYPESGNE